MKVFPSPCQEWGLKVFSKWYDLLSSVPSDATSVPMSVRHAAMLEKTLRSALESYKFQFNSMTPLFIISGDSGQIPLELWPSWRHEVNVISSVTWRLPSRRIRSAICCQILSSTRRISLRLPLLTLLDMRPGMYFLSWGSQSRPSTSHGTTRCWHFALSSASRGRTQSSSASAPPQSSQSLLLDAFYAPQEVARSPDGVFRG